MSQAGVINAADANPDIPIYFDTDTGPGAVAVGNVINIFGSGGIVTSGTGNTITIDGSGITPPDLTITGNTGGPQSPVANNWNIITNNTNVKVDGNSATFTMDFAPASQNLFLGTNAVNSAPSIGNSGYGYLALDQISTGISNCAFGHVSSTSISAGNFNSAFGEGTLFASGDVSGVVAFGWHALIACQASFTIGIGYGCMAGGVSGDNNLAIGTNAFPSALSGDRNLGIGTNAGVSLTSGDFNIYIGHFSGGNGLSTGSSNILIGDRSGFSYLSSESNNISIGNEGIVGDNATTRLGNSITASCYISGIAESSLADENVVVIDVTTDQLGIVSGKPQVVLKSPLISVVGGGTRAVYTVDRDFIVTGLLARTVNSVGASGGFVGSLGFNSPTYDNITSSGLSLPLTINNYNFVTLNTNNNSIVPSGSSLVLLINNTDPTATVLDTNIYVIGFYA